MSSHQSAQAPAPPAPSHHQNPRSGRWVVVLMFLFAVTVTLGLWSYWEFHTRPFRPLTDAIGNKFPGSNPRVEGGKHGMHLDTDRVLRIVLRIDYNPDQKREQHDSDLAEIMNLVREHVNLAQFDRCDIHMFQQLEQQEPQVYTQSIELESENAR